MNKPTECCRIQWMRRWRCDTLNGILRTARIETRVWLGLRLFAPLRLRTDFLHMFFVFLTQELIQVCDVASRSWLHDEGVVISFQADHIPRISQSLTWDREDSKDILCAKKGIDTSDALHFQELRFTRSRYVQFAISIRRIHVRRREPYTVHQLWANEQFDVSLRRSFGTLQTQVFVSVSLFEIGHSCACVSVINVCAYRLNSLTTLWILRWKCVS